MAKSEDNKSTNGTAALKTETAAVDALATLTAMLKPGTNLDDVLKLIADAKKQKQSIEQARFEATAKEREALAVKIKSDFNRIKDAYAPKIIALVGEEKAMIKLVWDHTNADLIEVAIMKGTVRKAGSGGGGAGKKYGKSTDDLLAQFGDQPYKENGTATGMTLAAAYASNTDGNFRFKVRKQLITLDTPKA